MKKRTTTSTVIIASAIAALPLVRTGAAHAQRPPIVRPIEEAAVKVPTMFKYSLRFEKWPASTTIVGIDNGNTIYQNGRGEVFYLDPTTGDMVFLPPEVFLGFSDRNGRARPGTPLRMYKWSADKFPGQLAILGMDEAGHVIHQNARGEKFYLDPITADIVFVK